MLCGQLSTGLSGRTSTLWPSLLVSHQPRQCNPSLELSMLVVRAIGPCLWISLWLGLGVLVSGLLCYSSPLGRLIFQGLPCSGPAASPSLSFPFLSCALNTATFPSLLCVSFASKNLLVLDYLEGAVCISACPLCLPTEVPFAPGLKSRWLPAHLSISGFTVPWDSHGIPCAVACSWFLVTAFSTWSHHCFPCSWLVLCPGPGKCSL